MIIEVDIYSAIRTRFSDGESIRSIAKSLGISRQTVKKYCEGSTHPEVRKAYQREACVLTSNVRFYTAANLSNELIEAQEYKKLQLLSQFFYGNMS